VKPVNLSELDGIKLGGYTDWKRRVIEATQIQDSDTNIGQYTSLFISKFFIILRGSRLTPERLSSMIVGEDLTL